MQFEMAKFKSYSDWNIAEIFVNVLVHNFTVIVRGITQVPNRVTVELTHLPLDKMAAISQTIFSDAFSWLRSAKVCS